MEAGYFGSRLRLARPRVLQCGSGGFGRLAGAGDGGLLASYVAIELLECPLDLTLRRAQDVELCGRLCPLRLHLAPLRGRIISIGRGRAPADRDTGNNDGRKDLGEGRQ